MTEYLPNSKDGSWYSISDVMGSYGKDNPSSDGHNPKCAIDSKSCSNEMSLDIPTDMNSVCLWHHARMAASETVKCGCSSHVVCNGDAIGRWMYRSYHDLWDMAVADGIGVYCCGTCQNGGEYEAKCGDMYICAEHLSNHKKSALRMKIKKQKNESDSDDESEYEFEGEAKDGPVKVLPPGIFGLKKGNGFEVNIAHDRGNVQIKSYLDAMKVHSWFTQDGDEARAFLWFILASHMEDCPPYIYPIEVEGMIRATKSESDSEPESESES